MSRIILLVFCLVPVFTFSKAQSVKEMLAEIEGKWKLDDNGNVSFVKILELPGMAKDEIYTRALAYFTYKYGSGKSVIQTNDKEAGLIIGKGLYDNVHTGYNMMWVTVDTWHILRIDSKEGKARLILTLPEYYITTKGSFPSQASSRVAEEYPVNPKGGQKTIMTKAFYKSYILAMGTLDSMEKAIKEGNTSKRIESDKW